MANNEIILNNLSDDAKMKRYISDVLMPRVFHDIPLNVLNTGHFSIINEYMSQAIEQQSYTASFFFNESFITKAVLPDSIYAEAAIFNIGYSYAIPSSCNFLLELKIEDIYNNAKYNPDSQLYEFILDKNTKFNLSNGNVYSLDYDILIQYKSIETSNIRSTTQAWNVQYTNMDEKNVVAKNKDIYITYRVSDTWLCLLVQASEYERETHIVVNNMANGIPNEDKVIKCNNHIAGFDIKYIDGSGNETYIPRDHILPIHSSVTDGDPYVHYIMDNPQTIRFMFQLNGNKYFVPKINSSFEITIYTCHGEAANFTAFKKDEQPFVITSTSKYSDNANVMKAAFVISGSLGGTNIGTIETVRRETIEAYNTANVISSDHDIDEWFKTFYFKNVLYPFFFKRRDDPWGRIWSGYLALKDSDDHVFRTNTLHCKIPYDVLYNNNKNTVSKNEIIIPPGLLWIYGDENRYTVIPYTKGDGVTIETAKTFSSIDEKYVFSNPFGIRIQKQPFAIGYFNPWINEFITATKIMGVSTRDTDDESGSDISAIYHATPIATNITRTYKDDYYKLTTFISPTIMTWIDGSELVRYVRHNAVAPTFTDTMWNYFKKPIDMFSSNIPIVPITNGDGYIPFNPDKTYLCVRNRNRIDDNRWALSDIWIDDLSEIEPRRIFIPITGDITIIYGSDEIWGNNGHWKGHEVYVSGDTAIGVYPEITKDEPLKFERITTQNYYVMKLNEDAEDGVITDIVVGEAIQTELTKYGATNLVKIGKSYASSTYINIHFANQKTITYNITNAANIYMPYKFTKNKNGEYVFNFEDIGADGVILYADMRPAPDTGAVEYYRIPLSSLNGLPMFYIANKLLPVEENHLRVIVHAMINGSETGMVEMQPVQLEEDNSYRFEVDMYPMNELVDIDNRVNIASVSNGGGNWIPSVPGSNVNVDASNPEFKISILVRTQDQTRDSEIQIGDSYTGFRVIDEYMLDDVSLIQELKEMRSVVNFGESSTPTIDQKTLYNKFINLDEWDDSVEGNIKTICLYSHDKANDAYTSMKFKTIQRISKDTKDIFDGYVENFGVLITKETPQCLIDISDVLDNIISSDDDTLIDWKNVFNVLYSYKKYICDAFDLVNINGGVEIQQVPLVESSLMKSDRFISFVSSFTQVHKAIEPVIMHRLEGNNYLDCKLIATYGLPHSYSSDLDFDKDNVFWPDLSVQIEFDVKLYNPALTTNTINELKLIIKSYFNRLTSLHTPTDALKMDNNIYISHIIQQMEEHPNVAYMKFKGFYTNEKNSYMSNYMNSETQAIVQKWKRLEDMPTCELERFVPEMFVLEDDNIVINIL